ncbi:unnamed protein product [Chrysodeixis includens]|uniref:Uncharacterized protein n=1 Tax=Chrysodeixis includens TaxID=689277 RepID=A0A9N8Q1N4_CHRIL|nr:unnamed protein product [Chrysodeixis includens]
MIYIAIYSMYGIHHCVFIRILFFIVHSSRNVIYSVYLLLILLWFGVLLLTLSWCKADAIEIGLCFPKTKSLTIFRESKVFIIILLKWKFLILFNYQICMLCYLVYAILSKFHIPKFCFVRFGIRVTIAFPKKQFTPEYHW